MQLTATRRQLTLPAVPALGVSYIATFDVKDGTGAPAGTAWAGSSIVDISPDGPVVLSMVVLRLPDGEMYTPWLFGDPLQDALLDQHSIEVPIMPWPKLGNRVLRVSAQLYNEERDYVRLADALRQLL